MPIKLIIRLKVKGTNKSYTPKECADLLGKMYDVLENNNTEFVTILRNGMVDAINGATESVDQAKVDFEQMLASHKMNRNMDNSAVSGAKGKPKIPDHDRQMDRDLAHEIHENSDGVTVEAGRIMALWDNIVINKGGKYYYRAVMHYIDHLAMRLKGFNLYTSVGKSEAVVDRHIESRDILYSTAMIGAPQILKSMKNIVLNEVFK